MANNADWRSLPAGVKLDLLIMQTMGWRIVDLPNTWIELYKPDGQSYFQVNAYDPTWGISRPLYYLDDVIVSYSRDLNAWNGHVYVLWRSAGKWGASFDFYAPDSLTENEIYVPHVEYGDTPALTVCRAFLGWKEATNEQN